MRTLLLPLGLAALLCSPLPRAAFAAPDPADVTLTLAEALALAESRNPTLSAARRSRDAADGTVLQAGLRRNPELDTGIEDTRRATRTSAAVLAIPIETGGKRDARIAAAERGRDAADAGVDQARAALRSAVVDAFFAVLVAQEQVQLANDSSGLAARAADIAGRRVVAGKAPPLDEVRARVDATQAELTARDAAGALSTARERLAALWGDDVPRFAAAGGDLDRVPVRANTDAIEARLDTTPDVAAARVEIERRRAVLDVERRKRIPDVTVRVGAQRDNELGLVQAVVGLSVPLQIFDRNQGNVYEAAVRIDQATDEYEATRIATRTALKRAGRALEIATASADVQRNRVLPAAALAYDTATRGFEAGKFAFLEVLDAQRALLAARGRYLDTLSAAHRAAAEIDRLAGR